MNDELRRLVDAADGDATLAFLAKLDEAGRLRLGHAARAELKRTSATTPMHKGDSYWSERDFPLEIEACARVAVLGTLSVAELAKAARGWLLGDGAVEVWRALRPSWLRQAAEIIIAENVNLWSTANDLVRSGLSDRPTHDNYALAMLLRSFAPTRGPRSPPTQAELTIAERLLEEPTLLEHEVWRLFELEGTGETSLAAHDKYVRPARTWATALITLMNGGHLARPRLIDASLGALERDFAAFRASWFARFHEQLEPTSDERRQRLPAYARLLASQIPATASFALAALKMIDRGVPLKAGDVIPHVGRVLVGAQKGPAKDALALLTKIAVREPTARAAIARAAVTALSHGAAEVQKAALDVLDRLEEGVDPETAGDIAAHADGVAATLRKRAAAWGDSGKPAAPLVRGSAAPRVGSAPVTPQFVPVFAVASVEDLVDVSARVLEDDGDPIALERVLDGISRLSAERPANFDVLTSALHKRAKTAPKEDTYTVRLRSCVASLVLTWLGHDEPAVVEVAWPRGTLGLFAAHTHAIGLRVATGRSVPLLSLPTHEPCWIAPGTLVDRVLAWPADLPPLRLDAIIALLRLAPAGRSAALEKLSAGQVPASAAELALALAHALGGAVKIGADAALWIAAARARAPYEDDPKVEGRHPDLGPGAGRAAKLAARVVADKLPLATFERFRVVVEPPPRKVEDIPREHLTVLFHAVPGVESFVWHKEEVRWAATLWPSGLEAFFVEGVVRLAGNLNWHTAYWHHIAFLEPLLRPDVELGAMARLVLLLGLAAKEPGEKGLAVDAAIAALEQGRVTGEAIGATMASLSRPEVPAIRARERGKHDGARNYYPFAVSPRRWATTLAVVAHASAQHARAVRIAIQRSLRGDPASAPRDEGALIQLLVELCAETETTIDDPSAAVYLSSSRQKKVVAAILPR